MRTTMVEARARVNAGTLLVLGQLGMLDFGLSLSLHLALVVLHLDPLARLPETRRGVHGEMEEEAKETKEAVEK